MIKLLIVDDSALMRRHMGRIFGAEGDFEITFARNGAEALAAVRDQQPDVVTLDVNMPEMDGLTCLSHIMTESPRPVVMVSSLTSKGALATLEALELGAVDFIPKPDGTVSLTIDTIERELVAKVRAAAKARLRTRNLAQRIRRQHADLGPPRPRAAAAAAAPAPAAVNGLVLIGVSTGGPGALDCILPLLPADFRWPVVICQHMPANFTGVLARRLNGASAITVEEVESPTLLRAGTAYIARGDADLLIARRPNGLTALPAPASPSHIWHPSVDRMVESALEVVDPARLIGVLLTGMGNDGAAAMTALRDRRGRTIAESEETAVVWGMPQDLIRRGGADVVLPVHRVAEQLEKWVR
ncbi:two-component system chemotaxis response regulator CheB [Azospirillum fermentarium]|uniref:chemotaxis-specific protein-glutamate methyltransferase CheB n=1 Tax=Azospirillum fermentarium TaxID=1233114 RepID=UPI002226E86C|nr:chemotaxis-specific protein-glutamate methyltransferase CheB [Azospirillum fermentarium]MCW2248629.1 two-component system chemotaxis response regulator CheB [Azospirillum fermentarium]